MPLELIAVPPAHRYMDLTMIPTIRPKVAPMAMDGTKIPAGTFDPYEMMTKPVRKIVARSNELAILHCAQLLYANEGRIHTTNEWQPTGTGCRNRLRPRTPEIVSQDSPSCRSVETC